MHTDRSRQLEQSLVVAGFVVLFAFLPHTLVGDDAQRFADIQALLHEGQVSDGRYSLVMPILSAPFVLLGSVLGSPEWWAARFNVVVVAVGSYLAWRLLRSRLDSSLFRRLLLALLFASYLTNRLRDYNAEVLTATLVALGIVCLVTNQHIILGWAVIVIGVVNTPAAILGLAAIACAQIVWTRRLRHALPVVAAFGLVMAEALIRRGDVFATGYEEDRGFRTLLPYSGEPGFSYPFVLGLLSILFSFGRGLLLFAPGLTLWLSSRTRRLGFPYRRAIVLMLLFVAGLIAIYAKWWAWYGGISWGPRFFVFAALPASLFIVLRQRDAGRSAGADATTLGVLAISAWVGLAGALADLTALSVCARDSYALESFCWYLPEFSSLLQPLAVLRAATPSSAVVALYCVAVFAYLASPLVATPVRAVRASAVRMAGGTWRL